MRKVLLLTILAALASCAHKHYKVSKVNDKFELSPVESRTRDVASSEFIHKVGLSHFHFETQKEKDDFVKDLEEKYKVDAYQPQGFGDRI